MDSLKTAPPHDAKLHFLDYWRIIRIRKTVILAVFFLVVLTATVVTFTLPVAYSSKARIKVERDQSDISSMASPQGASGMYDPYFIQTEFEVIQSEAVLGGVVKDLNLTQGFKKYRGGNALTTNEAIDELKRRLDLRTVRNTSLIEITYFSEDKKEAKDIANAIAEAYQRYRLEQRKNFSEAGIESLKKSVKEQEAEIHSAQSNVDFLRVNLQVST